MNEQKIISILSNAFDTNKSVNYAILQDERRIWRLKNLVRYSMNVAKRKGELLLNESQTAAALLTYSSKNIHFAYQALLNLRLIMNCIGLSGIKKLSSRKKYIDSCHPKTDYIYLSFIGTDTGHHGKGHGSNLLNTIIKKSDELKMPIYLETSMPENIPFYIKNGFTVYHEKNIDDCGFVTYFIRRENAN